MPSVLLCQCALPACLYRTARQPGSSRQQHRHNCLELRDQSLPRQGCRAARSLLSTQPRGELYFSDIYAERRLPEALLQDEVLHGECLGGALYWNDFENLAIRHGFLDPRLVEDRPRELADSTIAAKLGNACFFSAIYRLCKPAELEPACED